MYRPIVLIVLDGWGISQRKNENVLRNAKLPTIDKIKKFYPMTTLQASGISVGLPWGEVGNSEVGHITLGAGKIIYQNLPRISLSIQDRSFFQNPAFLEAMNKVNKNKSALHLVGLVGTGSTHSYIEHLFALVEMAKEQKVENLFIHVITDGRDSSPTSGITAVKDLESKLKNFKLGKIATICGRNWSMDRNNNWDRIEKAYRMMTEGTGEKIDDSVKYMESSYAKEVTDEYLEPAVITENGKPLAIVQKNDSVIFFNFREDRARELTQAFVDSKFEGFSRSEKLDIQFVTMTEYEKDLPTSVAFPKEDPGVGLGGIISQKKMKQLRIAETEKYAHVTYFFNGGKEEPWTGEDRVLVPSPSVSKFDETPEMSAPKITEKVVEAIESEKYDFILLNYANADMIGHTGNKEACIGAVQSIDKSLSILIPVVLKANGCMLITADHGNVEEIKNTQTGEVNTEHSANPVPLWYITLDNHKEKTSEKIIREETEIGGLLSDVAPTVLEIMGIPEPEEMNGESLLPILK
jgi:2,3-bisphosphoglycerate-independent phosphoglycerate mutase